MIKAIVAADEQNAIGRQGDLLCHLSGDLKRFKALTMGGTIIMGRKTWESFPRRPLPGRHNIVITRADAYEAEGATIAHSLEQAMVFAQAKLNEQENDTIWIIGGGSIYREAVEKDLLDEVEMTRIHHSFEQADTWFPTLDGWNEQILEAHAPDDKNDYAFSYVRYTRKA